MFQNTAPTILIANGANLVGLKLAEILLDQGSNVIMLDEFDESKIKFAQHFKKNKNFIFLERDSFDANKDKIKRLNYTFMLLYENNSQDSGISSKNFVKISHFIDSIFEFTQYKRAKSILVTSIHSVKENLMHYDEHIQQSYHFADIQKHAEKIAFEYAKELNLNNRIVRVGNVFGPEMNVNEESNIVSLIKDSLTQDSVTIKGDGLEYDYYIYVTDAVYGLIKAIFDEKTKNKVYSLCYEDPISTLSLAKKILEAEVKANSIKFVKPENEKDPLLENTFITQNNLKEIGWQPYETFESAINQTVEYIRTRLGVDKVKRSFNFTPTTNNFESSFLKDEPTSEGSSKTLPNTEKEPETIAIQVNKVRKQKSVERRIVKKFRVKSSLVVSLILIGIVVAVYLTTILPVITIYNDGNKNIDYLASLNSAMETKSLINSNNAIARITANNQIDSFGNKIKSLEGILSIIGKKDLYNTLIKSYGAYQKYEDAVEKINSTESIRNTIYKGNVLNKDDVLTIQTLNQTNSELNDSIDILQNVSLSNLPDSARTQINKMILIEKDIIKSLGGSN